MTLRAFGAFHWKCAEAGQRWTFEDGWGTYGFRRYSGEAAR
ncbi:hypothetical protein [Streptomyces sp. NPDC101455]